MWRDELPAADPDAAVHTYQRLHLQQMDHARSHLTAWNSPRLIGLFDHWHKQQWRRRQGEEPER